MTAPAGPLEAVADGGLNLLIWLFNAASNHPKVAGALTVWLLASYLALQTVRGLYPDRTTRPPWARVLVAVAAPVASVLMALLGRLARLAGGRQPVGTP